jgi:hypothetical protein
MIKLTKEEIQFWVNERFGRPNTFNTQLLEDFQDYLYNKQNNTLLDIAKRGGIKWVTPKNTQQG